MCSARFLSLLWIFIAISVQSTRAQQTEPTPAVQSDRPIQVLLVTGGCCHDCDRQKLILTRGISARANVRWTVVHQGGTSTDTKIPLYDDPNWADGFDIVVHNECFSGVTDKEFVDRILKPHREGLPAILIHCSMHCCRVGDDRWFEFCGVQYFQDDRWPAPCNDMLLTCDWGRSEVFSHRLPGNGATFDTQQDTFLKIPRPTDADVDASGRLFVTSWKNGNFAFERPDVGFVAMITPSNSVPHPIAVPLKL